MVWTVDDPAEARKFAALKIDAITTNRPGFLREELKK
jgi:glycerophosphoryl diester phosphodiesterase